ncbi:MAG: thioredoxin family protein [Flavobacteriaceae bacterium]|jgi:hypothetical protein|nr:thioredoxin family protein [Flavobacteriaceae bacterium]
MRFSVKLLLFALCCFPCGISAQQIELSFPVLPEKKVHIYYSKGNREDSLLVALDKLGKGKTQLPENYMGFIRIHIPGSGSVECIGGEPLLKIESRNAFIDKERISFPGSRENSFLYRMFKEKDLNINRNAWIQFGMELYDPESDVYKLLEKENKENTIQKSSIAGQIKEAGLYASKLLNIMDHINDMGVAIDAEDTLAFPKIKAYFHEKTDWNSLYTSGRLWKLTNAYYTGLFEKENLYAEDILPLFGQLQEPIRSAFLETTYETCEKLGWDRAKERIVSYISEHKITWDTQNSNLKRILASEKTGRGKSAPPLKGLANDNFKGISLIFFYDSGCDHCLAQLEEFKKQYAQLINSGVRVVSVSADVDERIYEHHAGSFPWNDKLCDYKGFMGENFINYAIIGTPTIFAVADDVIMGRYSNLSETGLVLNQGQKP